MKNLERDIAKKQDAREVRVSFRNHGNLSLLKYDYIQFTLKELIHKKNTHLIIDIRGVKFIDGAGFDVLNLLSRLGKKYNSTLSLVGVEPEVMEMIVLIKKYTVFDIKHVEPLTVEAA